MVMVRVRVRVSVTLTLVISQIEFQAANSKPTSHTLIPVTHKDFLV